MDVNPDRNLAWRDLILRVRFQSNWNVERRAANTLPLSGTRQAMWHLSKRRGEEVGEVVVVVREAPRDKVWEEVKGAGWDGKECSCRRTRTVFSTVCTRGAVQRTKGCRWSDSGI